MPADRSRATTRFPNIMAKMAAAVGPDGVRMAAQEKRPVVVAVELVWGMSAVMGEAILHQVMRLVNREWEARSMATALRLAAAAAVAVQSMD